jgi:hypothetical protein
VAIFWRFGVAGLLLGVLSALLADLWLREPEIAALDEERIAPASRHTEMGASSTAGLPTHSLVANIAPSAMDHTSDVAAPGVLRVTARAPDPRGFDAPGMRSVGELDRLDLTRLPRAPSVAEDAGWRDAAGEEAQTGPAGSEPLQPEASTKAYAMPVARPKRSGETARNERDQQQKASLPEKAPAPRPAILDTEHIAAAQRKLIELGFDIGQADGRTGPRTDAAVRDFQTMKRLGVDGRIDDRLLTQLDAELRHREIRRQQELAAVPSPPRKSEPPQPRGMFGSMMGGFQRLIGREFDSLRRPGEIAAYCRASPDNWIYDFGREAFVYCGNVNASGVASIASGKPAEAAGP